MRTIFSWVVVATFFACPSVFAANYFYVGIVANKVDGSWVNQQNGIELFKDNNNEVKIKSGDGESLQTWSVSKDGSLLEIILRDADDKVVFKSQQVFGQVFYNFELADRATRFSLILKFKKGIEPIPGTHRLTQTQARVFEDGLQKIRESEHHGHGLIPTPRVESGAQAPSAAEARIRHWEDHPNIERIFARKEYMLDVSDK